MDSLSTSIWRCRCLCRRTQIRIFKSLVIPVLLYGCETWTLNTDLKRQIDIFDNKCFYSIVGASLESLQVKSTTAPWDWIKAYYQHSPLTSTPAIWACGMLSRSWSCFLGDFCKGYSGVEEAKGAPTKFVAVASRCFLLGFNCYGKKACMGTCTGWSPELASVGWRGDAPLGLCPQWLIAIYISGCYLPKDR